MQLLTLHYTWAIGMIGILHLLLCLSWTQPCLTTQIPFPALSFLYTAYAECKGNLIDSAPSPHGIWGTIPIVGRNSEVPISPVEHPLHSLHTGRRLRTTYEYGWLFLST